MQILRISNTLNTSPIKNQKDYSGTPRIAFAGQPINAAKVESKVLAPLKGSDKFKEKMAKFIAKHILDTNAAEWLVNNTKHSENLAAHLSALTSVTLSGFYMKKTLDNKDLDPHKKVTLAINQGGTTVLSTILSYALNKKLDKTITDFTKKFLKINSKADAKTLLKYEIGIKAASSLMIFGLMFRFIAPVAVTPIANHIGNKLQEKKEKLGKKQND